MKSSEVELKIPLPSRKTEKTSTPPPVPLIKLYPIGTRVLATLQDGKKVEGIIRDFDKETDRFKVVWEKNSVIHVALLPVSDIKKLKVVAGVVQPVREEVDTTMSPYTEMAIADILGNFYEGEGQVATTEILDGKSAATLKESTQSYDTLSGYHVAAATDKCHKKSNQDRAVVSPRANMIAVVDGMGGTGEGEKAAEVVAMELVKNPVDIKAAAENAMMKINQHNLGMSGACFLAARVRDEEGNKKLDYCQAGDVGLIVIGENGKIKYKSTDQSLSNILVKYGNITEDESYYSPKSQREVAINSIATQEYVQGILKDLDEYREKWDIPHKDEIIDEVKSAMGKIHSETVDVEAGDRVVIFSDGISDNFTPEEIASLIADATPEEAIEILSDETDLRMMDAHNIERTTEEQGGRAKTGKYSDDYLTKPKKDNRGITIMDI
jgi:serine/threonine protein phosphatase PrpC